VGLALHETEWLDTGHYLHWDAPAQVAERIRTFA
jgi:hypothetical protein